MRDSYLEKLLAAKSLMRTRQTRLVAQRRAIWKSELARARSDRRRSDAADFGSFWAGYFGGLEPAAAPVHTAVERETLGITRSPARSPKDFQPHPKIERGMEMRQEMAAWKTPVDWSAAEALAFASLAAKESGCAYPARTASAARSAIVTRCCMISTTGIPTFHCSTCSADKRRWRSINSPLSEIGVLGFEYGYSLDCPDGLIALGSAVRRLRQCRTSHH